MRASSLVRFATFGLAGAALLACTMISGADALSVEPAASDLPPKAASGGSSSTSSGSAPIRVEAGPGSSSGAPTLDAAIDVAVDPSATLLVDEGFSKKDNCLKYTTDNASLTYLETDGIGGSGACLVCATGAGPALLAIDFSVPTTGAVSVEGWARRVLGASGPSSGVVKLVAGGANISSSVGVTESWTRLKGGSVTMMSGTNATVRFGIASAAASECLVLDELHVALR